jgi:hypothetical protein
LIDVAVRKVESLVQPGSHSRPLGNIGERCIIATRELGRVLVIHKEHPPTSSASTHAVSLPKRGHAQPQHAVASVTTVTHVRALYI